MKILNAFRRNRKEGRLKAQHADARDQRIADLEKELGRAYRCIRGFWTAHKKSEALDQTATTYHSPTIGAACRFVAEGSLDGAEYFIGKHVSVLHQALDK